MTDTKKDFQNDMIVAHQIFNTGETIIVDDNDLIDKEFRLGYLEIRKNSTMMLGELPVLKPNGKMKMKKINPIEYRGLKEIDIGLIFCKKYNYLVVRDLAANDVAIGKFSDTFSIFEDSVIFVYKRNGWEEVTIKKETIEFVEYFESGIYRLVTVKENKEQINYFLQFVSM